ncbi:MAG: hypothetical protein J0I09_13425 [Sphingobacteriia bacterium]|nr:hypothetical protein [Sphingobacteriia bacterium]
MKNNTSTIVAATIAIVFLLMVIGSAPSSKPVAVPQVKASNYYYKPNIAAEKNNISLAIINPAFAPSMSYPNSKLFTDFSAHMSEDIQQMATANGYNIRGPFETVSSMVYNDKQACLLYLLPEINIGVDYSNLHIRNVTRTTGNAFNQQSYTVHYFEGSIVLEGRITMIFGETFTKEKIQAISIPLPKKYLNIASNYNYSSGVDFSQVLVNALNAQRFKPDPGILNPIITALEEYYIQAFQTMQGQLDRKQVELYQTDAEKVRKDANYFKQ